MNFQMLYNISYIPAAHVLHLWPTVSSGRLGAPQAGSGVVGGRRAPRDP